MMSQREREVIEYSPDVQGVLGRVPPPILRGTLIILTLIVVAIFAGSIVFRYPDKVSGVIKISSSAPTQVIVAQTAGYIDELGPERVRHVRSGEIIASIRNSVETQDAMTLKRLATALDTVISAGAVTPEILSSCLSFQPSNIGSLSGAYNQWIAEVQSTLLFLQQDYYSNRIKLQQNLVALQTRKAKGSQRQAQIVKDRYLIAQEQFMRDSILHLKGVLSDEEYEASKALYKQAQNGIVDFSQAMISTQQGLIESKISLSDIEKSYSDQRLQHYRLLAGYTRDLLEVISLWEKSYLLLSPIDGTLRHWGSRYNHQYVQVGETLFSIEPTKSSAPQGAMLIPPNKAGKIVPGQKVMIRLSNYPDEEFGVITGEVTSISTLPDKDGNYRVDIQLPEELTTNYGKRLPVGRELQGTGEIITTNYRLIERFIMPIRKIVSQNT